MKIVFVCGPWGSGTSAVANMLMRLGCLGLPPYFKTNDPKTLDSFESIAFRNVLLSLAAEETFSVVHSKSDILSALAKFKSHLAGLLETGDAELRARPLVLKYPLSCLFLDELDQSFDAQFIFVHRSIAEIEQGRLRRGWAPFLGGQSAVKAFASMDNFLSRKAEKICDLQYRDILADPVGVAAKMATFCNLPHTEAEIGQAILPVKQHPNFS